MLKYKGEHVEHLTIQNSLIKAKIIGDTSKILVRSKVLHNLPSPHGKLCTFIC